MKRHGRGTTFVLCSHGRHSSRWLCLLCLHRQQGRLCSGLMRWRLPLLLLLLLLLLRWRRRLARLWGQGLQAWACAVLC